MRQFATEAITAAAVAAGLPESAVMVEPDKDGIMLPPRRVEIAYLAEQYTYTGRPIRKTRTEGKESTHRTLTRERQSVRLPVRAVVRADDEAWLKDFSRRFIAALPKRMTDEDGNTVTVAVEKAEYGGFTTKQVEVFKKRSKSFHVAFTGMTVTEKEISLIKSVDINPSYREAGNEEEN
ncbi:hypothetical protein [Pseudodesulfovibrio indicus]|uniref:Uncharacterized protein n=1 Tax=Pseudodesulfovibrio indicus TaxID=1716143 RepID=A0A126QLQ9_9BACT|nr:hypothetical protein [Pseudodesulfovibrio indicus]AMK10854.1 hypothetical protein AWY79_06910 [Pseudodesulfovibrio indicus]TDT91847.1 hypothetical protein EDC59_101250 [Pseudodesulfovibrio indicus]